MGGIGAITIFSLALFFLKRRQRRRLTAQNLEKASATEGSRPALQPQAFSYYSGHTSLVNKPSVRYPEPARGNIVEIT